MTMEEIRDLAHCSLGLISKIINNYREFGQVRVPFTQRMGRPSTRELIVFFNVHNNMFDPQDV
ncbi:hypothetical protein M413DRAFT_448657 [Hebeloma cylindrosporum]|uniref:Uncharacterized protein n=1 Tax=Hebeloma cylindrosporum TaxID=76867 RepID=A0A0C2Y817_HEBCY|nr:hypothetical protein M413DRAFT_448657 [Hebeloma cylindrosporum h7]